MAEKISLRIEATDGIQNDDSSTYLVSGPIEIYATVDNVINPDPNLNNEDDLYSEELLDAIRDTLSDKPDYKIVVFVNKTDYLQDSSSYRGSYYAFLGFQGVQPRWKEVAIGTHSHDNISTLNKLKDFGKVESELFLKVIPSGESFEFELYDMNELPDLPQYIKDQYKEDNNNNHIPDESYDIYTHLDAAIDELGFIGDPDNPEHDPEVIGRCSDVYKLLQKLDYKLYLSRLHTGRLRISYEVENNQSLNLYDINIKKDDIPVSPTTSIYNTISFSDVDFNETKDSFLFLIDEVFISSNEFTYKYVSKTKTLHISFLKNIIVDKDSYLFTVIHIDNEEVDSDISVQDIYHDINLGDSLISLDSIRSELYRLYVYQNLQRRTGYKKVYLTNDENGNVVWDNSFIPSGTYKLINNTYEYSEMNKAPHSFGTEVYEAIKIEIPDVFLDSKTSYITIFNNLFVFDAEYEINGNMLNIYIKTDGPYYNELNLTFNLAVLVINSGADEISDLLAKKYVSKHDAISLLTRGTISLDNYATKDDLNKKANIRHTHSQYSAVNHHHDGRYADYRHIHPEYATIALVLDILNEEVDLDQISDLVQDLLNNYDSQVYNQFLDLLTQFGFDKDNNTWLWDVNNIDVSSLTETYKILNPEFNDSDLGSLLEDLILKVVDLQHPTDLDIKISDGIKVMNPIGRFPEGYIIDSSYTLREVLVGLFDSSIDPEEATQVELKYYIMNSLDVLEEINEVNIPQLSGTRVYIRIFNVKNIEGDIINTEVYLNRVNVDGGVIDVIGTYVENGVTFYHFELPNTNKSYITINPVISYGVDIIREISDSKTIYSTVIYMRVGSSDVLYDLDDLEDVYYNEFIFGHDLSKINFIVLIPHDINMESVEFTDVNFNEDITPHMSFETLPEGTYYYIPLYNDSSGFKNIKIKITLEIT